MSTALVMSAKLKAGEVNRHAAKRMSEAVFWSVAGRNREMHSTTTGTKCTESLTDFAEQLLTNLE
eukprot:1646705-Rhodomonas_salina.2